MRTLLFHLWLPACTLACAPAGSPSGSQGDLESGSTTPRVFENAETAPVPARHRSEVRRAWSVDLPFEVVESSPEVLQVSLPRGEPRVLRRSLERRRENGGATWIGRDDADPGAYLALFVEGTIAVGHLRIDGREFRIQPAGPDRVLLAEMWATGFTCVPGEVVLLNPPPARTDAPVTIDVMVAYTSAACADAGSESAVEAEARLVVDETNELLERRGVEHSLRLVHCLRVDLDEDDHESMEDHRLWLKGAMDDPSHEVSAARDEHAADVVSLWVSNGFSLCGQARGIAVDESHAGHVLDRDCHHKWTFAHETGHLLGVRDDVCRPLGDAAAPDDVRVWNEAAATVAAFR